MDNSKMFTVYKGFSLNYFKIGQLIKITVKNFQGMFLEVDYGFIKQVSFDKIVFIYLTTNGEQKEREITPMDLEQREVDINIEIVSNQAIKTGR